MNTIFLCIVIFLICLAVFDLFVGVSNDAVNFLQSAVGAKAATFRTVLIIASFGVLIGAVMSSGMMDVARHGIMSPDQFNFNEAITIFLAVMVTDVIVLDVFNTLGMPTSTTVSMVFELLGGTFALATIKMIGDNSLSYGILLNTRKAMEVISAIFFSVIVAFIFGIIVMWISRIIFTFNYKKHGRWFTAIFGGLAFTVLAYFIFIKGLGKSPYIHDSVREYIKANTGMLLGWTFVGSTVIMEIMHLLKVNIFQFVVLMGTFALAMAFAGNDLVNFIGVPLTGLDAYNDYMANGQDVGPNAYMMTSLMSSAKTPPAYLLAAGVIMIIAMATSKKAQNVIKTSVDLSRQDEGDEMFGSSSAARGLVRFNQDMCSFFSRLFPKSVRNWVNSRFDKNDVILADDTAAFDMVRAAVNLVLASMLITIGTNYKLPLSTTYVTFMVAMGTSLADRAWSRESAVFRVTGVLSVIGGWFVTAAVTFLVCAVVCICMFYGGIIVKALLMGLAVFMLIRSNLKYNKNALAPENPDGFNKMMRTRDPEKVWEILRRHVRNTQNYVLHFAQKQFNDIVDGFENRKVRQLGKCDKALRNELDSLKKYRRQEMLGLKKSPADVAMERNTWFHLGANSDQEFVYTLRRMLAPIKEHVDNGFNPLPDELIADFEPVRAKINELMNRSGFIIGGGDYSDYRDVLEDADDCRDLLSAMRKRHLDRIQHAKDNSELQVSMVYLNMLQESQELLNCLRHQLRAAKKFMEEHPASTPEDANEDDAVAIAEPEMKGA
jgi:phosphate/sulfate permease